MIGDAAGAVDAVIVTFNSEAVIGSCLASLPPSIAVTIVDNGSRDDTLAVARAARPDAHIVRTPRNMGYGAAANLGFAGGTAPYAILINPDVVLRDGAIEALVAAGERYPDAGLLAPCSRDASGRIEFRRRTAHARFLTNPGGAPAEPEGDCCAPYVGGAMMMFRRTALDVDRRLRRAVLSFRRGRRHQSAPVGGGLEPGARRRGEGVSHRRPVVGDSQPRLVDALAQAVGASVSRQKARRRREARAVAGASGDFGEGVRLPGAGQFAKSRAIRLRKPAHASPFARGREAQDVGIGLRHVTEPLAVGTSSEAS